jgi:hypothetical protein
MTAIRPASRAGSHPRTSLTRGRVTSVLAGIAVIAVLAVMASASCERTPPALEVVGLTWVHLQYGVRAIEGRVRNNTATTYRFVRVTVGFSHAEQLAPYSQTIDVGTVAPWASKRFATKYLPGRPTKFKLERLTGTARVEP